MTNVSWDCCTVLIADGTERRLRSTRRFVLRVRIPRLGRFRHPLRSRLAHARLRLYVHLLSSAILPTNPPSHTLGQDDDYAASVLAAAVSEDEWAAKFRDRAFTAPFTIFNNDTGFMEARNANGSWAGQDAGWTEGDMWAYTFDVVHDVPALIQRRGGNASFVKFLDQHFDGGKWKMLWIAALAEVSFQDTTTTPMR